MNRTVKWIIGLIWLPFLAALPATIHVPLDQPTIQFGITAASNGDTVIVAPGTYVENLVVENKQILLASEGGADVTVLSPPSAWSDILKYTSNSSKVNKVQGFRFTGVSGFHAIELMDGKMIVEDCQFVDNELSGEIGGAVMVWNQAEIRNCLFQNNRGGSHGGGIRWVNSGGGIIEDCQFRYNSATYGGGIDLLYAAGVTVRHNLFVADSAQSYGGGVYFANATRVTVVNNTFDSCISTGAVGGGLAFLACSFDTAYNNIIVNCDGYGIFGGSAIELAYSDCHANLPTNYYGIAEGTGAITDDPQFIGGTPFDYHLQQTSPCVNAGNPDLAYNDPDGSRNDIGRFFVIGGPYATNIGFGADEVGGVVASATPTFYWHYTDGSPSTQAGFEIEVGINADWSAAEMWQSGPISSSDTSITYSGLPLVSHATYYARIRVSNGTNWGNWAERTFTVRFGAANAIHVPADQPTIQSAINIALTGDTVLVAPGTYTENLLVNNKEVTLLSEGGADVTILSPATIPGDVLKYQNNLGKVNRVVGFKFTGVAGLHGIELMDGKMIVEGCQFVDNALYGEIGGAIMVWDKAEIRNCLFQGNHSGSHGGGIRWVNSGGGIVEHNEFRGNSAEFGGGIDLLYAANVKVLYNLFVSDTAATLGGAIYLGACQNVVVNNNTFDRCISHDNSGGGLALNACENDTVLNNIIANCGGYGVWASSNTFSCYVDYNDCYQSTPQNYNLSWMVGAGSISVDPYFVAGIPYNYHLRAFSPCIDAGNPAPLYNDPNGTRNDMGAFPGGVGALPLALNLGFGDGFVGGAVVVQWPTLYWHYFDTSATTQTLYEIEVGTDADWSAAEMWQSGAVSSSDTTAVYSGLPLAIRADYFLRIRVNNASGWGDWSVYGFATGIGINTTIHVPADQPTIQAGIDVAISGDTILVAPGSYAENVVISGKEVILLSEGGAAVTTLTPASTPSDILKYDDNADKVNKVSGFRFTGVNGLHAIELMDGKMIVEDCQFADNFLSGEIGGAIMVWNQAEIRNCLFENNRGGLHGGGIRWVNQGGGIVEQCMFRNNQAEYGAGIDLLYGDFVTVRHNLFVADTALGLGGAVYLGSADSVQLINNTVDGCHSFEELGGGFSLNASVGLNVVDNIIVNCGGFGIWENGTCTGTLDYNDCYLNTPADYSSSWLAGANSISADPKFVGGVPFDYHLMGGSPCIDHGNPDPIYNDPDGTRNDIGAFYFHNTPPGAFSLLTPTNQFESSVLVLNPTFTWEVPADPDSGDLATYTFVIATDSAFVFAIQRTGINQPAYTVDFNLNWNTRYWWKVKATDGGGVTVWCNSVFKFRTLRRGDANDDGSIDITDPVFLLNYIFAGGPAPRSIALADANCDGRLDISDAVYVIIYIFGGGHPPCTDMLP
jgi:hypothetical protein